MTVSALLHIITMPCNYTIIHWLFVCSEENSGDTVYIQAGQCN